MTKRTAKLFSALVAVGAFFVPAVALADTGDSVGAIAASIIPKILIGCVIGGVVGFIARNNAIASMKSAYEKTQANDYAKGRGLNLSIANNQLIGRSQRTVPLAQMQNQGVSPYGAAGAGAGYAAAQAGRRKTDAQEYGRVNSTRPTGTGPRFDSRPGTGTFGSGGGKHSSGKPSVTFGSSRPSSGGKGGFSKGGGSAFGGGRSSGGKSFGGKSGGSFGGGKSFGGKKR